MSFTRFHDDRCRIIKQLQESTGPGRYHLNVPGNGDKPLFMEDPHIRAQKWGGNLRTNTINIESDLRGLTRNYNRDCVDLNNYKSNAVSSRAVSYPSKNPFTEESRATHPAWTYRDLEYTRWNILHVDPQYNVYMPLNDRNLNTRLIERDNFVPKVPKIN